MNRKKYRVLALTLISAVTLLSVSACNEKENLVDETSESSEKEEYVLETVEEQVLFDENGVSVIVNGLMDSPTYGKGVVLTFVNKTMKALTFDCKKMIVNGIMAPDLFGDRVQPGETVETGAYFGTALYDYLGIDNVGEIQFEFDCYDTEGYDSVYRSELVSVKTSAYDETDREVSFDGKKVFEGYGITIYGKMASDELFNQALLLYVENSTDKEFLFKADGVTIDGEFNEYLYPFSMDENANKLFYLEFIENETLEASTEDVTEAPEEKELEFVGDEFIIEFEIYDRYDASYVGETGPIKLNMK